MQNWERLWLIRFDRINSRLPSFASYRPTCGIIVSDIAIFVLKRDVKLQLTCGIRTGIQSKLLQCSHIIGGHIQAPEVPNAWVHDSSIAWILYLVPIRVSKVQAGLRCKRQCMHKILYVAIMPSIKVTSKKNTNVSQLIPVYLTGSIAHSAKRRLLWPPYEIGRPLYFCPVVSFLLSFFPGLISAVAGWVSTILPHMVWP